MVKFPQIFPKLAQIDAYKNDGYLIASPKFERRHRQFERFCEGNATPLVIIWPCGPRRRSVSMQLFNCTNSILDEEFQARFQSLAEIWRATAHQGQRLPVLIEGVTPRNARILSGYLHQLAIEAYERRANRIRSVLVVDGPPSDGKPKLSYGVSSVTCVLPIKGWRDFACTVELDNNERFQCGYKGIEEPQLEFIRQQFRDRPGHFRLLKQGSAIG